LIKAICFDLDDEIKLAGAKELGINTFVFENFRQFRYELELLGVRTKRKAIEN